MTMNLQQTKARIKSIASTKKITKAMELVATSKLKTAKNINANVTPYKNVIFEIMSYCATNLDDRKNKYLQTTIKDNKNLYIVITSTLGLCGGYNINIEKFVQNIIDKTQDELILVGTKGVSLFNNQGYMINRIIDLPPLNVKETVSKDLMNYVLKQYDLSKYQAIKIVSTKFINSLNFEPQVLQLLPLVDIHHLTKMNKELLLEPSAEEVLEDLIPIYLTTAIKGVLLESMLCEQASRRIAMESANDNANELQEKLLLEFNKSRQASITQEITEISGAANASK